MRLVVKQVIRMLPLNQSQCSDLLLPDIPLLCVCQSGSSYLWVFFLLSLTLGVLGLAPLTLFDWQGVLLVPLPNEPVTSGAPKVLKRKQL